MTPLLLPGDTAPWFHAPALGGNPHFAFDTVAGRPILLLFLGSAAWPGSAAALAAIEADRATFDDDHACFFGVTIDPPAIAAQTLKTWIPGVRWFLDGDGAVARGYRAIVEEEGKSRYRPHWVLLDPMLRVVATFPLGQAEAAIAATRALAAATWQPPAPVLTVPRLFPPDLCRHLIGLYEANGGRESGFMREENGITVPVVDHSHKRRADYHLADSALIDDLKRRLSRALRPAVARAFQFEANRIERWMVACYDGDQGGGYFRPHRDNTTKGTAHRRFAVTINLNAEDYDGGDLRFPEFGSRTYRAPTGGAVVFSCGLLHEATPVTRGRRYAFLPFLYDDAAARVRERNLAFVAPELQTYRSGLPPLAEAEIDQPHESETRARP